MKTNRPIPVLLLSSLALIYAGCSDDDKLPPDTGVDSGLDIAVDGPISDGPELDQKTTVDKMLPDLPLPSPHKVVVTEFLANPAAVDDQNGEWLELYNAGTMAVDITGWTLKDEGKDSHVIIAGSGDAGASLTIAPGQYVVLAKQGVSTSNGGVTAIYDYDDVFLANSSDEIVLLDKSGKLVDRIVYGSGWKITSGASLQLEDPSLDNNVSSNWCVSTTKWSGSDGDSGSPGVANSCAAAPDGGSDSGADTGTDSGFDSGTDTGTDSGTDSGTDTGADSGTDTGTDTGADTGTDAASAD